MTKEAILEELREACAQTGYTIRFEKGDFEGGCCILKDQKLLVVNKRFSVDKRAAVIARALGEIGLEGIYLKPAIRDYIDDEMAKAAQ